jgi:hypothetical protein
VPISATTATAAFRQRSRTSIAAKLSSSEPHHRYGGDCEKNRGRSGDESAEIGRASGEVVRRSASEGAINRPLGRRAFHFNDIVCPHCSTKHWLNRRPFIETDKPITWLQEISVGPNSSVNSTGIRCCTQAFCPRSTAAENSGQKVTRRKI